MTVKIKVRPWGVADSTGAVLARTIFYSYDIVALEEIDISIIHAITSASRIGQS